MTPERLAFLFSACERVEKWLDIAPSAFAETILPTDDARIARIEHVCHELGHATLLNIGLGPKLEDRVSAELVTNWATLKSTRGDWTRAELNEVDAFAVEMMAMELMGFELETLVFVEMCEIQVSGTRDEIKAEWSRFRATKRCGQLAKKIVTIFGRAMS